MLQTPPATEAPRQDEPMTECGSRPSGLSTFSSWCSVAPGRHTTCRPPSMSRIPATHGVHEDHVTVVVLAIRRRPSGQTCIGRLHDDELSSINTPAEHAIAEPRCLVAQPPTRHRFQTDSRCESVAFRQAGSTRGGDRQWTSGWPGSPERRSPRREPRALSTDGEKKALIPGL